MGFWSKIGTVLKKTGETYMEVGALTIEIQSLQAYVLSLRTTLPAPEVQELLQRIDRIKQAATAVVR